ncbi:MAG: hypothetical protein A3I05_07280 [Deltaproteobacteria bacterium RIFCSPLOWO2_02_FULL_44_10]|nr:MAG: hypothetical protein A3C46_04260 [Deltaproteobacteria bacterium RIFCSPHIGHO2_02_FULL_44_16]OGQ46393.1 MAG: hypothetical protein A3I05_07280 [Deltaproteobacteria bacterium RIFCSPLOWO2_02_FULL_44_10]
MKAVGVTLNSNSTDRGLLAAESDLSEWCAEHPSQCAGDNQITPAMLEQLKVLEYDSVALQKVSDTFAHVGEEVEFQRILGGSSAGAGTATGERVIPKDELPGAGAVDAAAETEEEAPPAAEEETPAARGERLAREAAAARVREEELRSKQPASTPTETDLSWLHAFWKIPLRSVFFDLGMGGHLSGINVDEALRPGATWRDPVSEMQEMYGFDFGALFMINETAPKFNFGFGYNASIALTNMKSPESMTETFTPRPAEPDFYQEWGHYLLFHGSGPNGSFFNFGGEVGIGYRKVVPPTNGEYDNFVDPSSVVGAGGASMLFRLLACVNPDGQGPVGCVGLETKTNFMDPFREKLEISDDMDGTLGQFYIVYPPTTLQFFLRLHLSGLFDQEKLFKLK